MLRQLGSYYDPCKNPIYNGHDTLGSSRKEVLERLPGFSSSSKDAFFERVFLPITCDGDPFWEIGAGCEGFLNHSYAPIGAMLFAIKSDPNSIFDMIAGKSVTEKEFLSLRLDFNTLFQRLRDLRGRGPGGTASQDEFIRLGILFFILAAACDSTFGLMTSKVGDFENPWCGRSKFDFDLKWKSLQVYSDKLRETQLSDLDWQNFFWRHISQSGSKDFWMINIPGIDANIYNKSHEVTREGVFNFITNNVPLLSRRGSRVMLTIKLTKNDVDDLKGRLSLREGLSSVYEGTGVIVEFLKNGPGMVSDLAIIRNYHLDSSGYRVVDPLFTVEEFSWREEEEWD